VFIWKEITVTVEGAVWRRVKCEKCEKQYFYKLTRVYSATGHSPYLLDNAGTTERARERAEAALNRDLKQSHDPVPCPHCGWFQGNMREPFARQRCAWMKPTAIVLLAAGVLICLICWYPEVMTDIRGNGPLGFLHDYTGVSLAVWVSCLVAAGLIAGVRKKRLARLDPNACYSEEERLVRGKELALTEEQFRARHPLGDASEAPEPDQKSERAWDKGRRPS
jgi:hypothetical protein